MDPSSTANGICRLHARFSQKGGGGRPALVGLVVVLPRMRQQRVIAVCITYTLANYSASKPFPTLRDKAEGSCSYYRNTVFHLSPLICTYRLLSSHFKSVMQASIYQSIEGRGRYHQNGLHTSKLQLVTIDDQSTEILPRLPL